MNILIVKSDQAKKYPLMFKSYIKSKSIKCFVSSYNETELYQIIKNHNLNHQNTLIHSRTAGPHIADLFSKLEKAGFKIINSRKTLLLTSNKYQAQVFAKKHHIQSLNTFKVNKNDLVKITDILKHYQIVVAKPVYSEGGGIFCKKLSCEFTPEQLVQLISDIPGKDIIIQEYIPFQKLIRVIVVGFQALTGAITYDVPKDNWVATVCMNPSIKKYISKNQQLENLAEEIAKTFNAPITYIDFFEDLKGRFILNELNTACGLIIHERITGVKIHQVIANYLIQQYKFLQLH